MNFELYPGSTQLALLYLEVLESRHVDAGSWMTPITLVEVSQDDVDSIVQLAAEEGMKINYRKC